MSTGTTFIWHDNSQIPSIPAIVDTAGNANVPTALVCTSCDRGPEKLKLVSGQDFYAQFGTDISFRKHGQGLIQAARLIDSGAKIAIKRIVADDATLANSVIVAELKSVEVQKTDIDGNLIYIDDAGNETTTVTANKAMVSEAYVTYRNYSISDINTANINQIVNNVDELLDEDGTADADGNIVYSYPIMVVADIGRGVSSKRFRIIPDYTNSKNQDNMYYTFYLYYNDEGSSESTRFCMNSDVTVGDTSMDLSSASRISLQQCTCRSLDTYIESFVAKLAEVIGYDEDELKDLDFLFGKTRKGTAIDGLTVNPEIDATVVDLSAEEGVSLDEGDNGEFGTAPVNTEAWVDKLHQFFSGELTSDIYNMDNLKLDFCLDANYPAEIKRDIEALADYRQDFIFFGDLNGLSTYDELVDAYNDRTPSKFNTYNVLAYDVIDPYSKKQVSVTYTFTFAKLLCSTFLNGNSHLPYAGSANGFTITEAIEGTENFLPVITPNLNQKELLKDMRLNYASYIDGILTLESEYTSQEEYTQLSWINNVVAIQNTAKAIRRICPKNRFTLMDDAGLIQLQKQCNEALEEFNSIFEELSFVYTQDEVMKANKIFNASIMYRFKDFVETEIFDLYALS